MTSPIEQVNSSSHAINTIMRTDGGPAFRCSVDLDASAGAVLDKDFILSVKAGKLDNPRCVAEVIPQQDSVALSLTLVPRFGVKPIPSQEYIFLIDRSGSMGGESKIEYAKKALLIMLKSLPTAGTTFNIFSFGSTYSPLWPASQPYSQASLTAAVRYESRKAQIVCAHHVCLLSYRYFTLSQWAQTWVARNLHPRFTVSSSRARPQCQPLCLFLRTARQVLPPRHKSGSTDMQSDRYGKSTP